MSKALELIKLVEGSKEVKEFIKDIGKDLIYDAVEMKGDVSVDKDDEADFSDLKVKKAIITKVSSTAKEWKISVDELLKGIIGKPFPFFAKVNISFPSKDISGTVEGKMVIKAIKHDPKKDTILITKSILENMEYDT